MFRRFRLERIYHTYLPTYIHAYVIFYCDFRNAMWISKSTCPSGWLAFCVMDCSMGIYCIYVDVFY